MSIIDTFLQKRKMHESQHGYMMVIIAYILSALLLALGSDTFYHITSEAAGYHTEIKEETQKKLNSGAQANSEYEETIVEPELNEAYDLNEELLEDNSSSSGDTVWLFGSVMNGETFDSLMQQKGAMASIKKDKETEDGKSSEEETITYDTAYGKITNKEVTMLERIVQAEAGGEDSVGKILIVNVIFNRLNSGRFPDSIKGVIFQHAGNKYQFSPVKSGRFWTVRISNDTEKAVQRALQGEDHSEGAMYFVAKSRLSSEKAGWFDSHLDWLFKHGAHDFYKRK